MKEKGKPRGRPFKKAGPGRPKGSRNKITYAVRELAQSMIRDEEYLASLRERLIRGEIAPQMELLLWFYSFGKPSDGPVQNEQTVTTTMETPKVDLHTQNDVNRQKYRSPLERSLLAFANLPEPEFTPEGRENFRLQAHDIFSPHGIVNVIEPDDSSGIDALGLMREVARQRLTSIVSGNAHQKASVLQDVVDEVRDASAQAIVSGVRVPVPCVPVVEINDGRARVAHNWLTSGIHACVIFGFLEIFDGCWWTELRQCKAPIGPGERECQKFYFVTSESDGRCSSDYHWRRRSPPIGG